MYGSRHVVVAVTTCTRGNFHPSALQVFVAEEKLAALDKKPSSDNLLGRSLFEARQAARKKRVRTLQ